MGNRPESTAAASDASDVPAEKYEYQAEVHLETIQMTEFFL